MSLAVPPVTNYVTRDYAPGYSHRLSTPTAPAVSTGATPVSASYDVMFDLNKQEIYIQDLEKLENQSCPFRNGDWIVITTASKSLLRSIQINELSSCRSSSRSLSS
jgi:hypothetical protein